MISEPSQLDREAAQIAAGLLAARAGAADGALAHLLSLLGLGPDPTNPIPSLPVAQLAARGLRALDRLGAGAHSGSPPPCAHGWRSSRTWRAPVPWP